MIALRNVRFSYGKGNVALACDQLDVGPGVTLLLGPNGAGKSTLLKLVAGVEHPTAGTVAIDGHDLWRDEIASRAALAYVPEHPDLTPYATVAEVLGLVCRLRGRPVTESEEALATVGLDGLGYRSVRELPWANDGVPCSRQHSSERRRRSCWTSRSKRWTARCARGCCHGSPPPTHAAPRSSSPRTTSNRSSISHGGHSSWLMAFRCCTTRFLPSAQNERGVWINGRADRA
jgi:hypothetical protein